MSSKDRILRQIKANKPQNVEAQLVDFINNSATIEQFATSLNMVGGNLVYKDDIEEFEGWLNELYGKNAVIYSEVVAFAGNFVIDEKAAKEQLDKIDVAILQGEFAVAENGAVWVERFILRALPFITQHLVLIVEKTELAPTMHEAYQRIGKKELPMFGLFISGPSKTADIEQSLVYGAHGARTLTVVLV
jgi:L-lactate dehydrogenase complex protein LldG